MSNVLIFDLSNGNVLELLKSVNTPDYDSRSDVIINPDMSNFIDIPLEYIKVENGLLREMTDQEKADYENSKVPPEPDTLTVLQGEIDELTGRIETVETATGNIYSPPIKNRLPG
ncbi:MAG: hypothetical protein WBM07_17125 [Chitinivibrionales bacterium]